MYNRGKTAGICVKLCIAVRMSCKETANAGVPDYVSQCARFLWLFRCSGTKLHIDFGAVHLKIQMFAV